MDSKFISFDDLVITDIQWAGINHLKRKTPYQMKSRSYYGIALKIEGETIYRYQGKSYVSNPNKIVILKKGASYRFSINEFGPCIIINFDILEGEIDFQSIDIVDSQKYVSICREIIDIFDNGEEGHKTKAKSLFYELLSILVSERKIGERKSDNKIDVAIKYINENLDKRITNTELAEMCSISEIYLRKLFLKITDTSPQQYIIEKKIKMAKSWLLTTSIAISEIAFKLGYPDVYSFSKSFKLHAGLSPQQYRKQNSL